VVVAVCRPARAAVVHQWRLDMNIFENMNHRGFIYQSKNTGPVRVIQGPADGHGNLYGVLDQGHYGTQHHVEISVRNRPNRDNEKKE
jgi:hypothetical protein